MSKRKQSTLGEFGFSKKVCHRDGEVDVIIPEFVEEKEIVKRIQCLHCSDKFVKKISVSDCSYRKLFLFFERFQRQCSY